MNLPRDTTPLGPVRWPAQPHVLPRDIFEREDVYREEIERIFRGPVWIPVAHDAEIPNLHDFKTSEIGEVPIVLTRDTDGLVHAFRNACTHRGTQLVTTSFGNAPALECPYHRWVFDSAGTLRRCPGEEDFHEDFTREKFGLRPVRLQSVFGLHFATLDPNAPSLADFLSAPVIDTIKASLGGDGRLTLLGYQKVMYRTNWKAYMDNDGWHAPMLHTAFRLLDWTARNSTIICTDNGHRSVRYQVNPSKNIEFLRDPSLITISENAETAGVIPNLFPITNMSKQMDIMTLRYAWPRGVDRTEVHWAYFGHQDDDEVLRAHRIRQSANVLGPSGLINLEDGAVFNRIQAAAGTGGENHFLKGVHRNSNPLTESTQNDELANLVFWSAYRRMMNF